MTRLSLAAAMTVAAAAIFAAPAAAFDPPPAGLSAASAAGVTVHRRSGPLVAVSSSARDDRRHRGFGESVYIGDREYQGDTAWRPEGFNDWWHERPLRNEPRWLRSNNCERQYWTGGGWRC